MTSMRRVALAAVLVAVVAGAGIVAATANTGGTADAASGPVDVASPGVPAAADAGAQPVADRTAANDSVDVAIVGNTAQPNSSYGVDYMEIVLEEQLNDSVYGTIETLHPNPDDDHPQEKPIPELTEGYDVFVMNAIGAGDEETRMANFLDNITFDQRVVYLDQGKYNANGIEELSAVRNDPGQAESSYYTDPNASQVELEITGDHPIFDGIGGAGDTVPLYELPYEDVDHFTFDNYTGETLGTLTPDNNGTLGTGVGIDETRAEALLPVGHSVPVHWNSLDEDHFYTGQAEQLLVNTVDYLATEVEPTPPGVVPGLEGLDVAGQGTEGYVLPGNESVTATVTNTGDTDGAFDVGLTVEDGGATPVQRTRSVSVNASETVPVVFGNISSLDVGRYAVTVSTPQDSLSGNMTVSIDANGDGAPATDTTGDGLLNDANGDGAFDIFDVQAFFESYTLEEVSGTPELFNFDGDQSGDVDIFDVQALFEQL